MSAETRPPDPSPAVPVQPESGPAPSRGLWRRALVVSIVPIVSILLGLLGGSIVIVASSVVSKEGFDVARPLVAYASLTEGAFGSETGIINTLVAAAPLILTGLAVGVGFKAGLFNIGATGQVLIGGFASAVVGAAVADQPAILAIPIAVVAGGLAGALYGFLPGLLKAFTGAHEVVTTIMLNSIAVSLIGGLVNDILRAPGFTFARTADVGNALLPVLAGRNGHAGVLIALAVVPIAWWLIWRTTLGFEIRTVGANPSAARYAGMSPRRMIVLTMSLCGMFAGLAGVLQILGLTGYYPATYGTSIGFDGITVAMLGRAHPVGIVFGAILLGAMRAGAPLMQINADVPVEIIDVIQGLILLFIAAEVIVRRLIRVRAASAAVEELSTVSRSYGEQVAR